MTLEEKAVVDALEVFRNQGNECITSLYAYLTIHAVAGKSKAIRDHINENALFWNTTLRALQTNLILAIGRVFESNTPHNVGTFMRAINANRASFSRSALRGRKASSFADQVGLNEYMKGVRSPTPSDIRRVANFVKAHRAAYVEKYRAIRDKVFAHTLVVDSAEITTLFSKTNIRELQRMTTYLGTLHDGVRDAFQNGGRIHVRPRRYSVAKMLKRPKGKRTIVAVQESTVVAAKRALQPWTPPPVVRMPRPP